MGMKGKIALGAVAGIVVIGVVSANSGSDGKDSGGDKGSSASAAHQPDGKEGAKDAGGTGGAKEKKKAAFDGDGNFVVGSDIKPGTYRTSGNTDGMCYWERAKDAEHKMDSILANDNVTGTSYVTIKGSDKLFKSSGCADWEAVDPKAKGAPAGSMDGDGGMFKVGTDIAPGTYRSTGNTDDSCYWERAKDAAHGLNSIIANDNVTGSAVVTIRSSDAYFKTTGCGDWKKTA